MKKYFLYISLIFAAISCSDDQMGTLYSGSSGLAFAGSVLNVEVTDEDNNTILVPVYRGSKDVESVSLQIEFESDSEWYDTDPEGIFSLVSSKINFLDETSNTVNAQIRFNDISKLSPGEKYKIRLTITEDVSPSDMGVLVITVERQLTFELLGECTWFDQCIFEYSYMAEIYCAQEAEVYRVMDPYSEGLIAEGHADEGWMGTPAEYIEFSVDSNGQIYYEPFFTGMLMSGTYEVYAYYPSEYDGSKDFSDYDSQNCRISDKVLQLYPVYCLPSFSFGFLNDGAYPITVTLP